MADEGLDWQTVELLGQAHYSQKGYRVLVPLVSSHGYDFVAERRGEFIRVNVKMAGLKNRAIPNSWSISQAGGASKGKRDTSGLVDVYLVYLPHQSRFIEMSGDFLDGGNSKSKQIPRHLFLS
jgi:hypothetical protein